MCALQGMIPLSAIDGYRLKSLSETLSLSVIVINMSKTIRVACLVRNSQLFKPFLLPSSVFFLPTLPKLFSLLLSRPHTLTFSVILLRRAFIFTPPSTFYFSILSFWFYLIFIILLIVCICVFFIFCI